MSQRIFLQYAVTGMNDLLRPALYKSYHEIVNLSNFQSSDKNLNVFDIVGPVCESSDCFFPKKPLIYQKTIILPL